MAAAERETQDADETREQRRHCNVQARGELEALVRACALSRRGDDLVPSDQDFGFYASGHFSNPHSAWNVTPKWGAGLDSGIRNFPKVGLSLLGGERDPQRLRQAPHIELAHDVCAVDLDRAGADAE